MNEIDTQERYEQVLSAHWHKLHQIKELVESDNGSQLRAMSISDRRKELSLIVNRKNAMEYIFDDLELVLCTPEYSSFNRSVRERLAELNVDFRVNW